MFKEQKLGKSGESLYIDSILSKEGIVELSDVMINFWFEWLQIKVKGETGKLLIPDYAVQVPTIATLNLTVTLTLTLIVTLTLCSYGTGQKL